MLGETVKERLICVSLTQENSSHHFNSNQEPVGVIKDKSGEMNSFYVT